MYPIHSDPNRLLCCDFCSESEVATGNLTTMYRLPDGLLICQSCLDANADVEADVIICGRCRENGLRAGCCACTPEVATRVA